MLDLLDLLRHEPWLIVAVLVLLAIVFGKTTSYLARVREAELDATLKQEMLQRGMSAEEIRMVIEARSRRKEKTRTPKSGTRQAMRQEMS
jgi:hypothetical protein